MEIHKEWLAQLKVGDPVVRMLGGTVPMPLTVTEITDIRIICVHWEFNRANGAEVDEYLGWDGVTKTGSFITPVKDK